MHETRRNQRRVMFNREARDRYLTFAMSPDAAWSGNFRDLSASVTLARFDLSWEEVAERV